METSKDYISMHYNYLTVFKREVKLKRHKFYSLKETDTIHTVQNTQKQVIANNYTTI